LEETVTEIVEQYTREFERARDVIAQHAPGDTGVNSPEQARSFGKQIQKLQPALKLASQPGMVAYGRLHPSAFDTWSQLGADRRHSLVDQMRAVAGLFPFANPKHGLKAFQFLLTAPERARIQPQWKR
jgi:hypothetical protein